jgi:hypothetical protein
MAITFTRAPGVAANEKPSSAKLNTLARAFNDRMLSGLGDPTWRIWWKAWSIFRNFETTPDGINFPADDSWFWLYANVEQGGGSPANPLNAANPINALVQGLESPVEYSTEAERLNAIVTLATESAEVAWEVGKAQRGCWRASDGAWAGPFHQAAISHVPLYGSWSTTIPNTQQYLASWGGNFGQPEWGPCPDGPLPVRVFTRLSDGVRVSYSMCYRTTGLFLGDVVEYGDTYELVWYDADWNATRTQLSKSEYVEGPYASNTTPSRIMGRQLDELMARTASHFRGSEAQRATDDYRGQSIAFDFQRYFTTQDRLGFAQGVGTGETLAEYYPTFTKSGPASAGAALTVLSETGAIGTHHAFAAPFALCGYLVKLTGGAGPVRVEFVDSGGNAITGLPTVSATATAAVVWLDDYEFRPDVYARLVDTLPAGVSVSVEFAKLVAVKPGVREAATLLRRAVANGTTDPGGWNISDAKEIGDSYFLHGAILTDAAVAELDLTDNPTYQAARRMIHDRLRLLKRGSFRGYQVADGKSQIHFDRTYLGVDLWRGLAPSLTGTPSGQILSGVVYQAHGALVYNGIAVSDMLTFLGTSNPDYTGPGVAFQVNGIVETAPARGITNRWAMFLSFNPTGGLVYDAATYGDGMAMLVNRCHVGGMFYDAQQLGLLMQDGTYATPAVRPQAPSAFNFSHGRNHTFDTRFANSCRMYPADYEVEKIECKDEFGNYSADRVRVTLKTRLRAASNDPATGWRSDENGLTDYLANPNCGQLAGDFATDVAGSPPATHGSCHPRFYFTQLIEEVHEDTPANTTTETTDTRMFADPLQWMVFCLGAMCEGYVAPTTTGTPYQACQSRPANYSWTTLCMAAFGRPWLPMWREWEDAEHTELLRPDGPEWFGPFPNTRIYVDDFNRIAQLVNLLTVVPLEFPIEMQSRRMMTSGLALKPRPASLTCGSGGGEAVVSMSADDYVLSGQYAAGWSDWVSAAASAAYGATDPQADGHEGSIEAVQTAPFTYNFQCYGADLGVLMSQYRGQARINPAYNWQNYAPAVLHDMVDAIRLPYAIRYTETWVDDTGPSQAVYSSGGGSDVPWTTTFRPRTHTVTEYSCINAALTPDMVLEVEARPLRASIVAVKGSTGNYKMRYQPSSSAELIGLTNAIHVTIPLE